MILNVKPSVSRSKSSLKSAIPENLARWQLRQGDLKVSEVATAVGFGNMGHFAFNRSFEELETLPIRSQKSLMRVYGF
jgi:hypothetical protein